MVHLSNDRCAWGIKEINLCIILYRNIWRIYVNLFRCRYCLMLHRCNAMTWYMEYDVVSYKQVCGAVVMFWVAGVTSVMHLRLWVQTLNLRKVFFFFLKMTSRHKTWASKRQSSDKDISAKSASQNCIITILTPTHTSPATHLSTTSNIFTTTCSIKVKLCICTLAYTHITM